VAAFKRKKERIEPWLTDQREKVRFFAQHYLRSLDNQIAAEQRRSEEELEFRKRAYERDRDEEGEADGAARVE